MPTLEIKNLCKHYPSFDLVDVSFNLLPGRIMGFIGRNGAGKSTTLKCIYNLVEPTSGAILYDGQEIRNIEAKAKSEIGLLFGEITYYPNKTVRQMSSITKIFYPEWNEQLYRSYLQSFNIDDSKKIKSLSSGMKVKYGLALALSHGAKILLLDEPTSGLDPVSRDELLDVFTQIVSDGEHSILFSTHVISDLEKCADDITYIQKGKILVSEKVQDFEKEYYYYAGDEKDLPLDESKFIHVRKNRGKFEAVARSVDNIEIPGVKRHYATLEEIMIALERGNVL
ncbi:MAG: ABC transporter ATP-binding protein [Bacilli bacterium]|jgi:ABC-2 type transport system ATP-binding protein|nr:ABC transporter ATP-binding protein [Bacilli bacterium]MCH4210354.1 ABC transporter ATP-binding protein [Bacilli bacterium]MCH4277980.1 ABC transporter ATP-binding protein [Bacilli bacterium]MCI2054756.1 ABC transporter ATP-binding protein [Bacilli bacterium]